MTRTPLNPFARKAPAKAERKRQEEFVYASGKSSLGLVLVALSEFGISSVLRGGTEPELVKRLQERFPKIALRKDIKATKSVLTEILALIEDPLSVCTLDLNMRGTLFQRRVWQAALAIPPGKTSTYSDIALEVKAPRSMRAVGSSCTNNHFSIIVPCHRVLHKDESIDGGFTRSSKYQQALILREINAKQRKK